MITELVHAKIEDELTLWEMAQSVELSPAHFSRMFRHSTGETPHQFVLRNRIERAKEMLRAPEARVLDVAVACGFKTQQHFARVFCHLCGTSPREYRLQRWSHHRSQRRHSTNQRTGLVSLLSKPAVATATTSASCTVPIIRSCARENLSRSPALSLGSRDLAA